MAKAESGTGELGRDRRVHVLFVALILGKGFLAQEMRQILVIDHMLVLSGCDRPGGVEQLILGPAGMRLAQLVDLVVVLLDPDQRFRREFGILVDARVTDEVRVVDRGAWSDDDQLLAGAEHRVVRIVEEQAAGL